MRTFWYRMTGRPLNLDDCVHYAARQAVDAVSLEPRLYESARELGFLIQYALRLTWHGKARPVSHEIVLVGEFAYKTGMRTASTEKANRSLDHLRERLQTAGICVKGAQARFTQPTASTRTLPRYGWPELVPIPPHPGAAT